MNLKDIFDNEQLSKIDKVINQTLERALNHTKLELLKIGCEQYLKKSSSHGADLTGSSVYYGLYLYFFKKEAISGFRENVISLIFVINVLNLDNIEIEVAIESVYEIKEKKIDLIDLQNNIADGYIIDIISMFIDSVDLFLKKELSENGVVPKKLKDF